MLPNVVLIDALVYLERARADCFNILKDCRNISHRGLHSPPFTVSSAKCTTVSPIWVRVFFKGVNRANTYIQNGKLERGTA